MLTRLYAGGQAVVGTRLINADIEVTGGVISAIRRRTENFFPSDLTSSAATHVVDCSGKVIAAGFIDLQCNGAFGRDITSDPSAIGPIAAGLPRFGITSWLPTVVTSPSRQRLAALDELAAFFPGGDALGDKVAVISQHQIAQYGTHQELINEKGPFARLWAASR